jgi:hypothetical protein
MKLFPKPDRRSDGYALLEKKKGLGTPLFPPVFGSQRPYRSTGAPHFRIVDDIQLPLKFFAVIRGAVGLDHAPCLLAGNDIVVMLI